MVFYVVYRASEEFKNRRLIPRRLKALGCRRIRGSFWEVDDEKVNDVLKLLQGNQPILLRRLREIRKPKFDKESNLIDFGSLVVFVYRAEEKDEMSKIRKLLKRAPCIRLCRAVYAFSQNHSFFDSKKDLIDARGFWMLIQEIDKNVKVFPRMVIANSESVTVLLERVKMRIEKGINDIVMGYRDLYRRAVNGEIDKRNLREEQLKLDRKFNLIKKLSSFYEKWLRMDFSNTITRPYPFIRKIRSIDKK